jgi:hypothetical protein
LPKVADFSEASVPGFDKKSSKRNIHLGRAKNKRVAAGETAANASVLAGMK